MDIKVIYKDEDVVVVDKPAGIIVFEETRNKRQETRNTLIDLLIGKYPKLADVGRLPRYGVVHRLDKDTSGILLVAKSAEGLIFLQKQFSAGAKALADRKNREPLEKTLEKRYIALATGNIKDDAGSIETFIGRSPADPKKQKVYTEEGPGKREAITEYKVLEKFKDYTLLEVQIKTGRKHQIRAHLASIHHPIAGDKLYGFKDSPTPEGLTRQFLHASYLKITLPNGQIKEFDSPLPEDLENILKVIS